MFGMPSTKREGQTMLNMCMEQCEGVYLMDEIERLREALETFANNVKETNEGIDENWSKTIYPLKAENQRLREELNDLRLSYEVVVAALREKE